MRYKSGLEQDERGLSEQELAELLERKAQSKTGKLMTKAAQRSKFLDIRAANLKADKARMRLNALKRKKRARSLRARFRRNPSTFHRNTRLRYPGGRLLFAS